MITKKEMICYSTDASRLIGIVEKVVFPESAEEIKKLIQTSSFDIIPRGAGSERVGGVIPDNSIVVDMSKMNKISGFNSLKKTVCVEAGLTIRELNERLNKIGFEFPIQTNNQGVSSIGGMIALNQIGNRSMKYGKMKDWVEEIHFVDGRGELMKLAKSDIMDVCGMEGTTGIIVSAILKIIPKVKRSISIFQSDDINEIFSVLRRLKLEKEICSLNLFPPAVSKLLKLPERYHIIIEFDSERGKIKGEEYETLLNLNDKVYFCLAGEGYYESEDPLFFFDRLKDFALYSEANNIPYFSKVGSGVIYAFFKDSEKEKKQSTIKMISKMGGKAGEYGVGLTRKYLKDSFERKLIERVKIRHDPFGKLNKNKLLDGTFKINLNPELKSKPNSFGIRHLKLIDREDIEEIKSFIEGKDDSEDETKTPEENMEEFIEKVELIEKVESVKLPELIKQPELINPFELIKPPEKILDLTQKQEPETVQDYGLEQAKEYEIKTTLKDYESTFKSELKEENKKIVEEFAKNITKEIIHPRAPLTEIEKRVIDSQPASLPRPLISYPSHNPNNERKKLTKEEEDEIKRIMFGGAKKTEEKK